MQLPAHSRFAAAHGGLIQLVHSNSLHQQQQQQHSQLALPPPSSGQHSKELAGSSQLPVSPAPVDRHHVPYKTIQLDQWQQSQQQQLDQHELQSVRTQANAQQPPGSALSQPGLVHQQQPAQQQQQQQPHQVPPAGVASSSVPDSWDEADLDSFSLAAAPSSPAAGSEASSGANSFSMLGADREVWLVRQSRGRGVRGHVKSVLGAGQAAGVLGCTACCMAVLHYLREHINSTGTPHTMANEHVQFIGVALSAEGSLVMMSREEFVEHNWGHAVTISGWRCVVRMRLILQRKLSQR